MKTETRDITQHLKRFALYEDYKTLYDKVVPPLKVVQDIADDLKNDWLKTREIVEQFDEVIATKA